MGVRKTADFLEKTTWTLAIILLVLSLFSILIIPKNQGTVKTQESEIKKQIDNTKTQPVKNFQATARQEITNTGTNENKRCQNVISF